MAGNKRQGVVALAYYEDLMALASWVEEQGFPEDAALCRETAAKIRPAFPSTRERLRAVAS